MWTRLDRKERGPGFLHGQQTGWTARSGGRASNRNPMLEGMYSAAAGMAAQQQRLDALSNDVANASTIGYKRQRVAFRDLVYSPSGPGGQQGVMEGAGAAARAAPTRARAIRSTSPSKVTPTCRCAVPTAPPR